MSSTSHFGWILGIGLYSLLSSGNCFTAQQHIDLLCDQRIRAGNVLVLNVEHLRYEPNMAQQFLEQNAGEFRLLSSEPEEIHTRTPPSRNPEELIRRARKLGSERGCDLVVVLKTGPYFGRQRSAWKGNGYGWARTTRTRGYALVVMGQRDGE